MKSRETLIRLKKFQVDEKRRKVAQIEAMIAEFERMATDRGLKVGEATLEQLDTLWDEVKSREP